MMRTLSKIGELMKYEKDLDVTVDVIFSEIVVDAEEISKIDGSIHFGMIQRFVKLHNLFRKNQWSILRWDREKRTDLTVKFFVRCSSHYLYKQFSDGFVGMFEYRNLDHQEYFRIASSVRLVGLTVSDNGLDNFEKRKEYYVHF